MDGIHDLGGMHGFGPVRVEPDEPVFHERWEGRVLALTGATGGSFVPNLDKFRHAIERLDPVTYLVAGYYGRWLRALETRLVEAGELAAGAVDRRAAELAREPPNPADPPPASAAAPSEPPARAAERPRSRFKREVDRAPRFRAGDAVRARSIHPPGHTRLPRYARGKRGRIASVYAAYVFPDTHAHDLGEAPQHLYCVVFRGEELWGPDAEPGTLVHLDLFEPYLEPEEGP
jgi:nitrile hydratase